MVGMGGRLQHQTALLLLSLISSCLLFYFSLQSPLSDTEYFGTSVGTLVILTPPSLFGIFILLYCHHRTMAEGTGTAGGFDPNFTQNVINAMGPKTSPRMRQVMASLIKHIHDFARETELTVDEWMAGVQLINWAGQMSTDRRNEGQLVCDVIGLESYVSP